MPHYLHQVAYSPEGWGALLKKPQDRIEAVACDRKIGRQD